MAPAHAKSRSRLSVITLEARGFGCLSRIFSLNVGISTENFTVGPSLW